MGTTAKKPVKNTTKHIPYTGVEKETLKLVIFDLWVKAYSYRAIQQGLQKHGFEVISISTISSYVKDFLKDHKAERLEALDDQKRSELIKLDKLEQTYWEAWERSLAIITTKNSGGWEAGIDTSALKVGISTLALDEEENKVVKGHTPKANATRKNKKYVNYTETVSIGDVRFLMGIERCIDKRCKLMGLDAPIVIEDKTRQRVSRVINITVNGKETK